ncbi:hypothetical protein PV328_002518 [Microctonus aethiopoides]|uniref:Mitochondrial import inner membrane translocase subunit Tim23 n=2 Tax=Microctonus aethiopoides TaxID=144406 RepID=A0AA39F6J9_9HYME|nr:hypothetical protein PV328_002518 [Microctonus aethiopoides]
MLDLRDDNTKQSFPNPQRETDNLNISTPQHGVTSFSPYLNFDPAYFPPSQPEFILLEGAAHERGRFEFAFGQIGAACIIGAGLGGATGFYRGLKATTLAGQTGKLRRTQLINHAMKNGASLANTLGIVSLMYSSFGVILQWTRGTDDSLNTLLASTATGMLIKSTAGLQRCAMGGGVGLALASMYCLWNNRDALTELRHHSMNPASK